MKKNKYIISFNNARKSEEIIRCFLLEKSDIIKLTSVYWTTIWFFYIKKWGWKKDPKFLEVLKNLENDFIREEDKNFYFKLTSKLKKLINEEKLFWICVPENVKHFYWFEDFTFYKNNEKICEIITHEPIIILYLNNSEKEKLTNEGVFFD